MNGPITDLSKAQESLSANLALIEAAANDLPSALKRAGEAEAELERLRSGLGEIVKRLGESSYNTYLSPQERAMCQSHRRGLEILLGADR